MRTKLIALVIASLFAPGSAWALGDAFNWSGSIEVGGRGVNTDGGTRNGAFGNFPGSTVTPFTGPADEAKAQEYQDVNNGVIGVVDLRGSSKDYYLKFFGENFGRDDQYINALGGGYNVFKAQIYSDRMPHNLSFNALTPLSNPGSTLQTVNYGENGTAVTAVPNTGCFFVDWSDSSTANPRTDTNVTITVTVTANFAVQQTVSIARENGQFIVSWDVSGTAWVLEQGPGWTSIPSADYATNGIRVLYIVPGTNSMQWFRLCKP